MSARRALMLALGMLSACHPSDVDPMKTQDKILPYRTSTAFADNAGMRVPPAGTVAREHELDPARGEGVGPDGTPLRAIPVTVDLPLLQRGRTLFEVTCAACHGVLGDGQSEIATKMALVKPTSLHSARVRALSPGELYGVIDRGYGLMNSYREQLPVQDRWAVVAYVHALQLSQDARLADLPAPARELLEQERP